MKTLNSNQKQKTGLSLLALSFILGYLQFEFPSNIISFILGFSVGLGLVFLISGLIGKRNKDE